MSVPRLCRAQQLLERGCACRLSTRYADCRPQMRDDKQRDTVVRTHIDGSAGGNNFALCLMSPSSQASLQHDCYSLLEAVHIRKSCMYKEARERHTQSSPIKQSKASYIYLPLQTLIALAKIQDKSARAVVTQPCSFLLATLEKPYNISNKVSTCPL